MKLGKNLQELAATLERNKEMKRDYVADTREMHMTANENKLVVNSDRFPVSTDPTDHFHNQIATYTGIGTRYYKKMLDESPALLAGNVNHWFSEEPKDRANRRMVRTLDGKARAFLSDTFLRVDNEHIAEVALTVFQDIPALTIESCDVTDKKLYIKATFPRTEREVQVGDPVQSGVIVSNGEVGNGSAVVDPFVKRLICLNGMAAVRRQKGFKRIHRGPRIENDGVVYQQDTINAVVEATLLEIRDAVTTFADPKWFDDFVQKLKAATETKRIEKPVEAVQLLGKTIGFSKDEGDSILERLIRGGDYTQYGMLNAVTNLANDVDSYDRATELEYAGGQILDLPRSQWERIAEAA